jgi:hypothetical protein
MRAKRYDDGWRPIDISIAPRLARERAQAALAGAHYCDPARAQASVGAALVRKMRRHRLAKKAKRWGAGGATPEDWNAYRDTRNRAAALGVD